MHEGRGAWSLAKCTIFLESGLSKRLVTWKIEAAKSRADRSTPDGVSDYEEILSVAREVRRNTEGAGVQLQQ